MVISAASVAKTNPKHNNNADVISKINPGAKAPGFKLFDIDTTYASIANSKIATILMILIIGLTAGPAVSL